MLEKKRYLYVLSFSVRMDSGIALVIAYNENDAKTILNNGGHYSRSPVKYKYQQIRCIGETCSCDYGLLMESYSNPVIAYEAFIKLADKIKGEKGDPGDSSVESIERALGYLPGKISINTTVGWNNARGYVPLAGEIVVYSDYATKEVDGRTVKIPGIKVGSGNGYVQDLAFIAGTDSEALLEHINDNIRHITSAERTFWNNKLNVNDYAEVVDDALVFNRN